MSAGIAGLRIAGWDWKMRVKSESDAGSECTCRYQISDIRYQGILSFVILLRRFYFVLGSMVQYTDNHLCPYPLL